MSPGAFIAHHIVLRNQDLPVFSGTDNVSDPQNTAGTYRVTEPLKQHVEQRTVVVIVVDDNNNDCSDDDDGSGVVVVVVNLLLCSS